MGYRGRSYVQSAVATVSKRRNKFDLSHGVKTALNVGELIPLDVQEVLPGDTFISDETHVVRLSSSYLRPVMDNVFMDTYSFFVPLRLLYDDLENVFGVAEPNEYLEESLSEIPTLPSGEVTPGSIADYMGLPVGAEIGSGVSVLPFRAFAMIYNEWFRNENVQQSTFVQKGDIAASEKLNGNAWSQSNYTGMPPKISKKKDYFTACLPAPQKGSPVSSNLTGSAPVLFPSSVDDSLYVEDGPLESRRFSPTIRDTLGNPVTSRGHLYSGVIGGPASAMGYTPSSSDNATTPVTMSLSVPVDGVVADLSSVSAISINDLRFAFQLQKYKEREARFGSRYREYILGAFGVRSSDARMQVPEFLGGRRTPLNMQQVAQTSAQTQTAGRYDTPLATLGGMSHSVGKSRYVKSFEEHGYVITVAAIRQLHTYQQGIEKMWFRKERTDFYDPLFANLGEQPVYQAQLYGFETEPLGEGNIFGYQEYGAEYRYRPSIITGQMRSGVENSLDVYHFGDYYSTAPTLSPQFIQETDEYFERTVAVDGSAQKEFILDVWFNCQAVRVMPLYSTPGLIDHH